MSHSDFFIFFFQATGPPYTCFHCFSLDTVIFGPVLDDLVTADETDGQKSAVILWSTVQYRLHIFQQNNDPTYDTSAVKPLWVMDRPPQSMIEAAHLGFLCMDQMFQ